MHLVNVTADLAELYKMTKKDTINKVLVNKKENFVIYNATTR